MDTTVDSQTLMIGFNILLGLVAFFGGMIIRDLSQAVKDLRVADEKMVERLGEYAKKDDIRELKDVLREMKDEERRLFDKVFDKLEQMAKDLSRKVDRDECDGCSRKHA